MTFLEIVVLPEEKLFTLYGVKANFVCLILFNKFSLKIIINTKVMLLLNMYLIYKKKTKCRINSTVKNATIATKII